MRTTAIGILIVLLLSLVATAPVGAADTDKDGLRDWFERKWSKTDPHKKDTDGDGVVDSAEDPDNDSLGNRGEQRFSTDPRQRDTDDDRKIDGYDDKNRNGVIDLLDQDRRRIPANLRPSLYRAPKDFPQRRFECQTAQRKTNLRPCRFGDTSSSVDVVIFGDSHAAQWVPALARAGEVAGWRIIQMTKTACPSIVMHVLGQWRLDRGRTCKRWRAKAFDWLRQKRPEVIIVTNRSKWTVIDNDGHSLSGAARRAAWRSAIDKTLARLPAASQVVVLSDTPHNNGEPVDCLKVHRRNIAACETRRAWALHSEVRGIERNAAKAAGAMTRNLNKKICTYDPCPLIQGKTLMWRDHGHLTATFSRRLWPSVRAAIRPAVAAARANVTGR